MTCTKGKPKFHRINKYAIQKCEEKACVKLFPWSTQLSQGINVTIIKILNIKKKESSIYFIIFTQKIYLSEYTLLDKSKILYKMSIKSKYYKKKALYKSGISKSGEVQIPFIAVQTVKEIKPARNNSYVNSAVCKNMYTHA